MSTRPQKPAPQREGQWPPFGLFWRRVQAGQEGLRSHRSGDRRSSQSKYGSQRRRRPIAFSLFCLSASAWLGGVWWSDPLHLQRLSVADSLLFVLRFIFLFPSEDGMTPITGGMKCTYPSPSLSPPARNEPEAGPSSINTSCASSRLRCVLVTEGLSGA